MSSGFWVRRRPGKAAVFRTPHEPKNLDSRTRRIRFAWMAAAFAVLVIALIDFEPIFEQSEPEEHSFVVKQIAREEWRAEFPFETVDLAATEKSRDAAAAKVFDIYTIKRDTYQDQLRALDRRFEALRSHRDALSEAISKALLASTSNQDAAAVVQEAVAKYAERLLDDPAFQGVEEVTSLAAVLQPTAASVPARVFPEPTEGVPADAPRPVIELKAPEVTPLEFANAGIVAQIARDALDAVLNFGVLDMTEDFGADPDKKVRVVRTRSTAALPQSENLVLAELPGSDNARQELRTRVHEVAGQVQKAAPAGAERDWAKLQSAAFDLAKDFVSPTLYFDALATGRARSAARAGVTPVMKTIERSEIMQRDGERWTDQTVSDVRTYIEKKRSGHEPAVNLAVTLVSKMIITLLALSALARGVPLLARRGQDWFKALRVCLLIMVGIVLIGRVASYFDDTGFVVPVAAGSILLAILTNARVAVLCGALTALLLSVQYGYDWGLVVVGCVMALAGAMSITVVRRRSDMARAAFQATIMGMLAVIAVTLATQALNWDTFSRNLMLVGLNGIACLFIVPGLLPPLERMMGIITDIQLLEYSDLNNEILSRLAIEVPATYAHSLMLGQLAEAASEAIGANGLLARVSAYYHDIGKIRRPEYFSENQTGANIHDGLSPRLSARAIASHVIEGAEMARELHLPKPIIDAILEHHGTNLISFFYQQAKEQSKHGDVREEDYRYPGPRPQSRETAILMICDAVESGVRSIKNPNEERVREFVDKIIQSRAADRQFDECDLTLKDLDTIGDVVARRILSTMHTRVAYPPQHDERKADNVIPMSSTSE